MLHVVFPLGTKADNFLGWRGRLLTWKKMLHARCQTQLSKNTLSESCELPLGSIGIHLALQPGGKGFERFQECLGSPVQAEQTGTNGEGTRSWPAQAGLGLALRRQTPHSLQSVLRNCVLCFFVVCIGGKTAAVRALHHRCHPTILWLFTSCKIFAIIYLYNFTCCHILSVNSDESYTNISVTYYFYTHRIVVRVAHDNLPIPGGFEGSKQSSSCSICEAPIRWLEARLWLFWICGKAAWLLASCRSLWLRFARLWWNMMELETSYVQRNHWLRWQWGETRWHHSSSWALDI